jgi:hypothetical protein
MIDQLAPLMVSLMALMQPIADAPVVLGEAFDGLWLLTIDEGIGWAFGIWDGEGWFTPSNATQLNPTSFLPLPVQGAVAAALIGSATGSSVSGSMP